MIHVKLGDEVARQAALDRLEVLDTGREQQFDKIAGLVRAVFEVPIVTVSLVDRHRQWFKAKIGIGASESARNTSFCTQTVERAEPLVVPDALADPHFADNPSVLGEPYLRAYAGAPLRTSDGYNVGALCVIDTRPRAFTPQQIELLKSFASLVVDELELRQIARSDQLTDALTRRGFLAEATKEIQRFRRHDSIGTVALLDIDHFKSINDAHGHPAGDVVLRELADRIHGELRPNDVLGRIGGEEFAVLLPQTADEAAMAAVERLRVAVAERPFTLQSGVELPVTASFGVAKLSDAVATPEEWLARADAPLYQAKRSGRNRCVSAEAVERAAA
ncbi:sensor domain-containing diguanylate cyclase [Erythrobacter sp. LQ02-29]|uniref:sensor domain-containing diguanylate cyclase n=1 Tax=Erythrobacter sp. LQ02-29 TaxID=2920384 RepID=UPI001F4DFB58|nr:sensor domain-containing diguanylate cyclase [Erythrobacter sp. LQ02-29]